MNTTNPFDILGWLWVILFVALWLKRIFWRWMNGARAVNWPVTDGSVHSASGPPFGTIHYSYKVADSYYSGMFWRKENGHVEASDLRARSLKVRYNLKRLRFPFFSNQTSRTCSTNDFDFLRSLVQR